jgi:hypothetical protein
VRDESNTLFKFVNSPLKKNDGKYLESFEKMFIPETTKLNHKLRLTKKASVKDLDDVIDNCKNYLNSIDLTNKSKRTILYQYIYLFC